MDLGHTLKTIGIAKLSIIPELFEAIIADHIIFSISSAISSSQHGFREGKSTLTNLTEFVNHVSLGLREHKRTDVIYTEAFNKENLSTLVH